MKVARRPDTAYYCLHNLIIDPIKFRLKRNRKDWFT
jgi:hypothetical protein